MQLAAEVCAAPPVTKHYPMPDPNREAIRALIAQIEATGKSLYYVAQQMGLRVTQVDRIKKSGRCQPHQRDRLVEILDDALRETSQNVTITATREDESVA